MMIRTTTIVLPTFDLSYLRPVFTRDHPELDFDTCEAKYRNYLALCKAYSTIAISPTVDIDVMWHCHILHTVGYWADCKSYFGYYLHHVPTTLSDPKVAATSAALYQEHFGTALRATCGKLATCIIDDQKIATCIIDDSPGQLAQATCIIDDSPVTLAARIDQAQFMHGPTM